MSDGTLNVHAMKGRRAPVITVGTKEFFGMTRRQQLETISRYLLLADVEVSRAKEYAGGVRALAPMARAMDAATEARRLLSLVKGGA